MRRPEAVLQLGFRGSDVKIHSPNEVCLLLLANLCRMCTLNNHSFSSGVIKCCDNSIIVVGQRPHLQSGASPALRVSSNLQLRKLKCCFLEICFFFF